MTKLGERPERKLLLPCGYLHPSRAQPRSTVNCPRCSTPGNLVRHSVSKKMLDEADRRAAGLSTRQPRAAASPAEQPDRVPVLPDGWQPEPPPLAVFSEDPGTCSCGTSRRWPHKARGTLARCGACGRWALPPAVHRAYSATAGSQKTRSQAERDGDDQELFVRIEELAGCAREHLAEPGLDVHSRAQLRWLLAELAVVARTRDARRLGELEEAAAGFGLRYEDPPPAGEDDDDDGQVYQGYIVDDDEPSPGSPLPEMYAVLPAPPQPPPEPPRAARPRHKATNSELMAFLGPPHPPVPAPAPSGTYAPSDPVPARDPRSGDVLPSAARDRGLSVHTASSTASGDAVTRATREAAAEGRNLTHREIMEAAGLWAPSGKTPRRDPFSTVPRQAADPGVSWWGRYDTAATQTATTGRSR